jgi:hypothetical protein
LDIDRLNDSPKDFTTTVNQTKQSWASDADLKNKDRLSRLTDSVKGLVGAAETVKWSPDELKVAMGKDGRVQVYDLKKDLLYPIGKPHDFIWYPDSEHLILTDESSISSIEVDGTNLTSIYGGSFENFLVFPWPDGSRLVILVNFNKATGSNLYTITLR